MKRFIPTFVCLCFVLAAAFVVAPVQAADQKPFVVHFVVVSKAQSNTADPAFLLFKKEVLELAGGYTELGATSGGMLSDTGIQQQDNVSFIIGADKDISLQLHKISERIFGDPAFILSWPGKVLF